MNAEKKSGFRTLLASVLLSAPGPLILGFGLMLGRSSTQISDFTRRTAELLAIVISFVVYLVTNKRPNMEEARKKRIERSGNRFVGAVMCFSGLSMLLLTFLSESESKGNVVLPFVIAFLGAVTNLFFWRKYTALSRRQSDSVLRVQARLYGAKSVVDVCVVAALLAVLAFPASRASYYLDTIGSVLVSLYMIRCGVKTILEAV